MPMGFLLKKTREEVKDSDSYFGSSIYETDFAVCNTYQKVTVLALKKSYRFSTEKLDNKHLDLQICHGKTKMNLVL